MKKNHTMEPLFMIGIILLIIASIIPLLIQKQTSTNVKSDKKIGKQTNPSTEHST